MPPASPPSSARALVTTLFTVAGKQVLHARPEYRDYVDAQDGTPPSTAQLVVAAEHPTPNTPAFWLNWTKFDYLYVLFTEDEAPNPDPSRLKLVADGDRFQLYRIIKPLKPRPTKLAARLIVSRRPIELAA